MELKQASVLLVEDEPVLREIMGAWLERVAGKVFCAADGSEAAEVLAANRIDLAFSDVRMPVMDGVELLNRINAAATTHRPCMIFITGFSDLKLRDAYDMGVDAILEKPIKREEMMQLAKTSVATAEELWRQPPGATPEMKLKASFESLAGALGERRIGFGRRGFCIETAHGLQEGPVEFAVEFRADHVVLLGQGVVRWLAPEEGMAGIEITSLDDAGRAWMIEHLARSRPLAFIPRAPGVDRMKQTKTA
ncbi:MAG TPA: response regulator [Candidatus Angelobacter sp.]